ncbi:uncharacterized protein LOC120111963 [Phoenix dactylifera]|uniref:Uncharacterized protein LOC120111963 n=1 Tax=Phoenix dactylifera TaxID=42345 RepID=A0A8B9AR19_PHODC|nr:uncharacterized protein LOC120111963 [Phoenix dactylifera]
MAILSGSSGDKRGKGAAGIPRHPPPANLIRLPEVGIKREEFGNAGKTMGRRKAEREIRETREMTETRERSVTFEDVNRVKNMIERCLMLYMNQKQTVETLWKEQKIERVLTETVWERLQQDNPDFFRVYYVRLLLKGQLAFFNMLLEKQANSMGIPGKSVCGKCGTALLHRWGATYVSCATCSAIISVPPQEKIPEHGIEQASTSLAAQYISGSGGDDLLAARSLTGDADGASSHQFEMSGKPSTELPLDADTSLKSFVPQDLAEELPDVDESWFGLSDWSLESLTENLVKHNTDSSQLPDQISELYSSPDLKSDEKIPEHGIEQASTSLAAQYISGSGGDDLLAARSLTGDADGASSHQFEMSGKPSTELPLDADTSLKSFVPQDLAEELPDVDESWFGLSDWSLESLTENLVKHNTDSSQLPDQISELYSSPDLKSDEKIPEHGIEQASTSLAAQYISGSGGDDLLAARSLTGDADGASSHQFEMSGKPSTELPLDADTSLKSFVPQDLAEELPDVDESWFGLSDWSLESLTENLVKHNTDSSQLPDQISELYSSPDLKSDEKIPEHGIEQASTSLAAHYISGSGGDDLLAARSLTGDADGASSHQFEMSGKPSTELPLDADTSLKSFVPQDLAEELPDVDESWFGLSDWSLESLTENLVKHNTDSSQLPDQISELYSSPDLKSDGADGVSNSVIPGRSSGHQRIQEDGNASVPAHGLSISASMLATENSNTGTFPQVINTTKMTDNGYLNNSGLTFSTDINQSGAAPDPPFQKLEMAEQKQILYTKTSSFELENRIPQILRLSDSTSVGGFKQRRNFVNKGATGVHALGAYQFYT